METHSAASPRRRRLPFTPEQVAIIREMGAAGHLVDHRHRDRP